MILDELVVDNFGVFAGNQRIVLSPPSSSRPVILVGGLNGGGKTTLLDAIQLALYGRRARCSNLGTLAYEDFLLRSIHNSVDPKTGAAVEVRFRHYEGGVEHAYHVRRTWAANANGARERVEVMKDGKPDAALTETWCERMEDLIPSRIAHLFFFDGEQIEEFADERGSGELLATAIHSLLGLDLVDQLRADLLVMERRKRADTAPPVDREEIEGLSAEIDRLTSVRNELSEQRASAQTELDRARKRLADADAKLGSQGGALFERRHELEVQRDLASRELAQSENDLREIAAGCAPLLLAEDLLRAALEQADAEARAGEARTLDEVIRKHGVEVLRVARSNGAPRRVLMAIQRFLAADRAERRSLSSGVDGHLGMPPEGRGDLGTLLRTELPVARDRAARAVSRVERLRRHVDELDRTLAGVPHRDAIAGLLAKRDAERASVERAAARIASVDAEVARATSEHDRVRARLDRKLAELGDSKLESDDAARIVFHSARVRETMERFRLAVVSRHVARIERLVLESFRQLLRKESLVSALRIDPARLSLELFGADGKQLLPERLSAGERQLLAVSIIWGLARAAGRPLPAVIDTPLGRLDSSHRTHLVERYFPNASHQVLLLSTDEEIDHAHYDRLRAWVGRSYRLEFSDRTASTTVEPGYFWE